MANTWFVECVSDTHAPFHISHQFLYNCGSSIVCIQFHSASSFIYPKMSVFSASVMMKWEESTVTKLLTYRKHRFKTFDTPDLVVWLCKCVHSTRVCSYIESAFNHIFHPFISIELFASSLALHPHSSLLYKPFIAVWHVLLFHPTEHLV